MYHFDPYSVLLAIATNIAVLRMTAFVLQGHVYIKIPCKHFFLLSTIFDTSGFYGSYSLTR